MNCDATTSPAAFPGSKKAMSNHPRALGNNSRAKSMSNCKMPQHLNLQQKEGLLQPFLKKVLNDEPLISSSASPSSPHHDNTTLNHNQLYRSRREVVIGMMMKVGCIGQDKDFGRSSSCLNTMNTSLKKNGSFESSSKVYVVSMKEAEF